MENINKLDVSVREELVSYIIENLPSHLGEYTNDIHNRLFNEDYYIVYHLEAEAWLKRHGITAFEAIEIVQDYELSYFGEVSTKLNPESVVNMLVYILGEELIYHVMPEEDRLSQEGLSYMIEKLGEV
jgi:hypothetical protein